MKTYDNPIVQKFHLDGVKYISANDAYELIKTNSIYFLDVREHDEIVYELFEFQNIFYFPMSEIMEKLDHLPLDLPVVVVCNDGTRGVKIANLLNRQGYKTVANLDGGINEWKAQKLPIVETGFPQKQSSGCDSANCGCSCSECG